MSCSVRIERIANGYEVCLTDPEIAKANSKPNSKYRDAQREYAFKTIEEVLTFLETHLDTALPADDYASSFDEAANMNEDDDE